MFFETLENIDFAGYVDDSTPYTYPSRVEHVLTNLQGASEKPAGFLKIKHHLLTSSNLPVDICIINTKISNEESFKLPKVNFEGRPNFD